MKYMRKSPLSCKSCIKCNVLKFVNEFYYGRKSCKECLRVEDRERNKVRSEYNKERCKKWKIDNRVKVGKYNTIYYKENKEEILEKDRNQYNSNKTLYRDRRRKKEYNLTQEELDNMKTFANGICEICKNSYDKLCIDHDHQTGKIRGLLCHNCNLALGNLRENIEYFQNAIYYLQKHSLQPIESFYSIGEDGIVWTETGLILNNASAKLRLEKGGV